MIRGRVVDKTVDHASWDRCARFCREARVAASLNHPNVCQIYEIREDHGELFIAMELLEGQSLSERLRNGPLSIADALAIEMAFSLHSRHCTLGTSSTAISALSRCACDWSLLGATASAPAYPAGARVCDARG